MNTQEWQRVEELLNAALELEPRERRKFLDEASADAPELRSEVESLLDCEEKTDGFLAAPAVRFAADLFDEEEAADALIGQTVGNYQIAREIGRGGMGTVYLAVRDDDVYQRQVAIKLIKRGMDTEFVLRRFRQERQILASLDHPNIAGLLDGGTTSDGLPYFVMEYVEGTPIGEYADAHRLSTFERLKLFRSICSAVSYAHQHLVIHRDIKPSNILVTEDGAPKLLDFGIAKLLDTDETNAATATATALIALTPEYASPEQVRGRRVTTATDVYSLGVVLYELLSGHRPHRFENRRPDEVARVICEEEPERPSTASLRTEKTISADGTERVTITPERISETREESAPERLRRRLAGDLDTIVLMAMRKEPARRYASVGQLSEDIRRHLEGLPVVARKDTFNYRAAKFVRRNRLGVLAAAVVLLTLIGGIVAVAWQAKRATDQARVAATERDRAQRETAKAERINSFLQNVLGFSDPSWLSSNPRRNREATIVEALDEAARRAETELSDQPEVLAAVHLALGRAYLLQNRLDLAETHLRASLDIRRRVLGAEHQDTAQSMASLGNLFIAKGNYAEAESLLSGAVSIYRRARDAGNVDSKWFTIILNDLSTAQTYKGNPAAAELTLHEALEVSANFTGAERMLIAISYNNLAIVRRAQGDLDGAIAFQERNIEEHRRLSSGAPRYEMATSLANLAFYLMMKGEYQRSEALFREAIGIHRNTVGETHQAVSYALINLADNYYMRGDYARAREEIERAIRIQQQLLPDDHVDYGLSLTVLGKVLTRTGEPTQGEAQLRRALAARTRALPQGHRWTAETQSALGECLTVQRRYAEAEPLLIESHTTLNSRLGGRDPRTLEAVRRLVSLYEAWNKPERAAEFRAMLVESPS